MRYKTIPRWLLSTLNMITTRQFKQAKRAELQAIKKAMEDYSRGCAVCPEYDRFLHIRNEFNILADAHSLKNWGR